MHTSYLVVLFLLCCCSIECWFFKSTSTTTTTTAGTTLPPSTQSSIFSSPSLSSEVKIHRTDMVNSMQQDALSIGQKALRLYGPYAVGARSRISRHIQDEFNTKYPKGWQTIIGKDFGALGITAQPNYYILFQVDRVMILLFKPLC
ncbi:unnamed protein product [Didymodactylos carnosus]|uniref:Dynein light chain n=1 Tax=Didymodactylos carnosus TaxID=1234261 RepID=A0A814Q087_9BILA|nr:unnamed protein product [Didymodactylos carnosus]CAF3877611.1 unnamed protein product [Didymodactylos carnosus]